MFVIYIKVHFSNLLESHHWILLVFASMIFTARKHSFCYVFTGVCLSTGREVSVVPRSRGRLWGLACRGLQPGPPHTGARPSPRSYRTSILDMFKLVQIGPCGLCLIDRCWYLRGDLRRDSHGNSKGQVHRRPGEGETSLQGLLPRSENHRARTG